jgi:hypothetical protein
MLISNYVYWEIGSFDFAFSYIFEFPHQCLKIQHIPYVEFGEVNKKARLTGIVWGFKP